MSNGDVPPTRPTRPAVPEGPDSPQQGGAVEGGGGPVPPGSRPPSLGAYIQQQQQQQTQDQFFGERPPTMGTHRTDELGGVQLPRPWGDVRLPETPYKQGDEFALFQGLSPDAVTAVQSALIRSGELDPQQVRPGTWGPSSAEAMTSVMSYANDTRMSWQNALDVLATNPPAEAQQPEEPQQLLPDYESVAQEVRNLFEQRLGRDPTEAEMQLLTDEFMADARRQGAAERGMPAQTEDLGAHGPPSQQISDEGTTPGHTVDPYARMESNFEQITAEEREGLEELDEIRNDEFGFTRQADNIRRILGV